MKKFPFLLLIVVSLLIGQVVPVLGADDEYAVWEDGTYSFDCQLANYCLNGEFPLSATVTDDDITMTYPGTLTLSSDGKGNLTGNFSGSGYYLEASGKVKFSSKKTTIALKLTDPTNSKNKASLKGVLSTTSAVFEGSYKGSGDLGGKGTFILNVADASALVVSFDLELNADEKGKLTGSGTATVCGDTVELTTVKGTYKKEVLKLAMKGEGLSWSGKGPLNEVVFKAKGYGASASDTIEVAAEVEVSLETKNEDVLDLPEISIDPASPVGGTSATVTITAEGAQSITLTATGDGKGNFSTHQATGQTLTVTQTVGDFGECTLTATATFSTGTSVYETSFTVEPSEMELPGVGVADGVFRAGDLPSATGGDSDPDISGITTGAIINGGTTTMRIRTATAAHAADISAVLVKITGAGGYTGYYEAPATVVNGEILVDVNVDNDFAPSSPGFAQTRFARFTGPSASGDVGGTVEVELVLVDNIGNVGEKFTQTLDLSETEQTKTQVTLSWDSVNDIDLHLYGPLESNTTESEHLYYSTDQIHNGTITLDHDSICDGVRVENMYWADGAPMGVYQVDVDYYGDCDEETNGGNSSVNYTITVRSCSETQTFTGSFSAEEEGSGYHNITTFNTACGARVRGKAVYADYPQTNEGLSTIVNMLPIRFATVEVVRSDDDEVLAQGSTKQDGTFDISFENDGEPGYYVAVTAYQRNNIVQQSVVNSAYQLYSVRMTDVIDEQANPDVEDIVIEADIFKGGPAFNIFDVGVSCALVARKVTGQTPPPLTWVWTNGQQGECGSKVSCYKSSMDVISVLSLASDSDEYDDMVLAHEYGHFFQHYYSRDDSPGGSHSSSSRVHPLLAWSEGSATFYGCWAKKASLYLDSINGGSALGVRLDLEKLSGSVPAGTTGAIYGDLSEAIVGAILWDLADATNAENHDDVTQSEMVFSAMSYMKTGPMIGSGITSGGDLIDFLDAWCCLSGYENRTAYNNSGLKKIVDYHGLSSYYFEGTECPQD